ncbi:hypothetical protein MAP00_006816 [Monascus purpureus]|nr:hypothetical protein MAP00_006816 [Monascus purpureus]
MFVIQCQCYYGVMSKIMRPIFVFRGLCSPFLSMSILTQALFIVYGSYYYFLLWFFLVFCDEGEDYVFQEFVHNGFITAFFLFFPPFIHKESGVLQFGLARLSTGKCRLHGASEMRDGWGQKLEIRWGYTGVIITVYCPRLEAFTLGAECTLWDTEERKDQPTRKPLPKKVRKRSFSVCYCSCGFIVYKNFPFRCVTTKT